MAIRIDRPVGPQHGNADSAVSGQQGQQQSVQTQPTLNEPPLPTAASKSSTKPTELGGMQPRPDPLATGKQTRIAAEVARLRALLAGPEKLTAAQQALLVSSGYVMRRSRAGRREAIGLCELVADQVEELGSLAERLRSLLLAEGRLHELSGGATLRACLDLIALIDEIEARTTDPEVETNSADIDSLAHAILAHGLLQLAIHFPVELTEVGLTRDEALQQAMRLAESAIQLAPELADGHVALGRLLLCHEGSEASTRASEVLGHAVELDPEHDPAQIALAVTLFDLGQLDRAAAIVDAVIRRGNVMPQPILLRGLIAEKLGDLEKAQHDFEKTIVLAPDCGLFHADLARLAERANEPEKAMTHSKTAKTLLGHAY